MALRECMHELTSQDTDVQAKHEDWVYVLHFGKIWINFMTSEARSYSKLDMRNYCKWNLPIISTLGTRLPFLLLRVEKGSKPLTLILSSQKKMTSSCALGLSLNLLFLGIVNISFQSVGTGKYATPTRHLNFHFTLLAVSYELYPRWN